MFIVKLKPVQNISKAERGAGDYREGFLEKKQVLCNELYLSTEGRWDAIFFPWSIRLASVMPFGKVAHCPGNLGNSGTRVRFGHVDSHR